MILSTSSQALIRTSPRDAQLPHMTPVKDAAQSISGVGGYTALRLLEMLEVGKKKKGKRNRSRKTASGLCLRFCETATTWQQNWVNQGFSHSALHRFNSQSRGSVRGWDCKYKAGASPLNRPPKILTQEPQGKPRETC